MLPDTWLVSAQSCFPDTIFCGSWLHPLRFWFCTLNHSSFSIRNGHVYGLTAFLHTEGSLYFELSLSFLIPVDDASTGTVLLNVCEFPKDSFGFTLLVKIHSHKSLWGGTLSALDWVSCCGTMPFKFLQNFSVYLRGCIRHTLKTF